MSLLIKDVPFEKVLCSRDLSLNATKDNWSFTLSQGQSVKSPSAAAITKQLRKDFEEGGTSTLLKLTKLGFSFSALENRGTERGNG